ncbi:helix-turn-helix domain-containing protein [Polaribacter sp. Asnod1-A03]|uniref:helix-turn-helix domain-containing protein n=1 Tax=Polaribacter sp. Asnod1-A03 TaxID=3160581 RepID=UPI003865E499
MSFLTFLILILIKSKVQFYKLILSIFFVNAFLFLLYYYSYLHKITFTAGIAILFAHGVGYLLGPSFLYLVKSLVFSKERILKPFFKTLIPFFIVFLLFNIPLFISITTGYLSSYHSFYTSIEIPFNILENVFIVYYIIKTLAFLKRLNSLIEKNYANISAHNLQWYKHFIIGFLIIVILDFCLSIYEVFYTVDLWNVGNIIAFMFFFLYVYLGYKGLYQSQIFIPSFLLDELDTVKVKDTLETDKLPKEKTKVRQLDSLKPNEIEDLELKLKKLLIEEKVYLDEELNLTKLSKKMNISNKKLSELINHQLKTTFYNLINDYRINDVKNRFKKGDTEKYTIISIAFDAGFKSKASFYRIFKQKEGVSPSAYSSKYEKMS